MCKSTRTNIEKKKEKKKSKQKIQIPNALTFNTRTQIILEISKQKQNSKFASETVRERESDGNNIKEHQGILQAEEE